MTRESARYLRSGDPDAGFVYYGVIDEVAHLAGSATPPYLKAIEDTDARIGRLLDAIRTRPTYLEERWIVLLTSDHGQQDFNVPSIASHGGGTDLERTSFVGVSGFGAPSSAPDPRIVDIAPTVYRWLGVPQAEDLDGKALLDAVPAPAPVARVKGKRVLRIQIRARRGAPALRKLRIRAAGKLTRAQAGRATKIRIKGRRRVIVTPDPGARIVTVRLTGEQPIRRARVRVADAGGTTTLIPVVAGR